MVNFEILRNEIKKYEGDEKVVIIPQEVTSLGDFAFSNGTFEKIVLHEGIDEIGEYCFYNCDQLVEIEIPDGVRFIGGGAFASCRSLKRVKLPTYLRNINRSLFFKSNQLEEVIIQENVINIEHDAFAYCESLKTLKLPERLKSIGNSAFEECHGFTHITLPDSVETLGDKVFFHCLNLKEITLSASLSKVGEGALQSHSYLKVNTKNNLLLTAKNFDINWNFDWSYSFKLKNGDNYHLHHSYLPVVDLKMWKPVAKVILIINFLETLDKHINKEHYLQYYNELKNETLLFIFEHERFDALDHGIEHKIIETSELSPYLDLVKDREQKAKLLEYTKETQKNAFDDLDSLLDDLF